MSTGSPETTSRDDTTSPVHRALEILELLGGDAVPGSLGVVEIARRLGRDKSQVSRTLRVLAEAGFVDREPRTLRYRVGTRLFAVAAKAVTRRLREEADQISERLAARLGERVEVLVPSGTETVTIASAAPGHALLAVGWVGRTQPLVVTAAGRCLLFEAGDEDIARLIAVSGLSGRGPRAPRSLDEVLTRVRADAARGFTVCAQEADRELLAVGAPVRDAEHRTVAAVQVSGPHQRMEEVMDEVVTQVQAAAREMSAALGESTGPSVVTGPALATRRPGGRPLMPDIRDGMLPAPQPTAQPTRGGA